MGTNNLNEPGGMIILKWTSRYNIRSEGRMQVAQGRYVISSLQLSRNTHLQFTLRLPVGGDCTASLD